MRLQFVGETELLLAGIDAWHIGARSAERADAQIEAAIGGDLGHGGAGRIGEEALFAGADSVDLRGGGAATRERSRQCRCGQRRLTK